VRSLYTVFLFVTDNKKHEKFCAKYVYNIWQKGLNYTKTSFVHDPILKAFNILKAIKPNRCK